MKKYLTTGIIILLPITLTVVVIIWLFKLLTGPFFGVIENIFIAYETSHGIDLQHHELLVSVISRITVLLLLFFLILLLGFIGCRFFLKHMLAFSQKLFTKIPVIKTVYNITYEVTHALLKQEERTFKETVLIPFPYEGTHTLGLITGEIPSDLRRVMKDTEVTVFVPTAPHPVSGYVLFAPRSQLVSVDISTEDVFRFLISCGIVVPKEKKE